MWCGKCQADVAAEVSPDNQRVFCTACGALLTMIDTPPVRPSAERPGSDKTKDARDLLQRWSSNKVLDPFGPPMKKLVPAVANLSPVAMASQLAANIVETVTPPASEILLATTTSPDLDPPVESTVVEAPHPTHQEPAPIASSLGSSMTTADKIPEIKSSSLPSSPSPFITAAMNSSLSGISRVENPLKGTPINERATDSLPPDPFQRTVPPMAAKIRIDVAHSQEGFLGSAAMRPATVSPVNQNASGPFAVKLAPAQSVTEPRRPLTWMPTWDPAVWRTESSVSGGWTSAAGQLLAYAGVLGLTIGACMVVWSYFGGPANHAPTGWLIATAGQMLLFFGVVTLVSGGLEQTTEQVNKRIEQLGDHIIRIEQAAREMNGRGNVPPAHFGHDRDPAGMSADERAVVER